MPLYWGFDAGFVSFNQMNDRLRAIANVTTSSIIADGDTGFGGLANIEQTVVGYEQSGADAIQLEDQSFLNDAVTLVIGGLFQKQRWLRKSV